MKTRPVIYQTLPRLMTNYNSDLKPGGTIRQNGCGKLNGFTYKILKSIKDFGATHIWYTGVIEHAHKSDYASYGIAKDNPHIVKGMAGSPYAITDYYDVDPDLAENVADRMGEFQRLVERSHSVGLKVVIDFVPNHVGRQYRSDSAPAGVVDLGDNDDKNVFYAPDNNFYYFPGREFAPRGVDLGQGEDRYVEMPAKATGNDKFTPEPDSNDWYETVKLNYGIDYRNGYRSFEALRGATPETDASAIPDTWRKMCDILLFWAGKGVDAFRCDMAHMVPVEFWHWAIAKVKKSYPEILFIAEIYDTALYREYLNYGGFDYLYDKVTLYDTLRDVTLGHRPASALTQCWQTIDDIRPAMLHFLENHDEVRFASPQYAGEALRAIPGWVVTCLATYGPVMVYFGQELGEPGTDAEGYSGFDGRTTIFDYWSLESIRRWLDGGECDGLADDTAALRSLYAKILQIATSGVGAMGRFYDLMYVNYDNPHFDPSAHYAFMKSTDDVTLMVAVNFSDADADMAINIPRHAFDLYGLPQGRVTASSLLDSRDVAVEFCSKSPYRMSVPARGAAIHLIRHSDVER